MPAHIRGLKAHRPQLGRTGVYDLQFELMRRETREYLAAKTRNFTIHKVTVPDGFGLHRIGDVFLPGVGAA